MIKPQKGWHNKGWHKFTDKELNPNRSFGLSKTLKIIEAWVNYQTEDIVHILKSKTKKPYLVHANIIGQLSHVGDKFFSDLTKAEDWAIELIERVKVK